MKQNPIIGIDLSSIRNSFSKAYGLICRKFHCTLTDCTDLSRAVNTLKHGRDSVFACLDIRRTYNLGGYDKTAANAFAILYDFVGGFVISGFDDLQSDIDPMINDRLFNGSYRPIYLALDESLTSDEVKDIIAYCLISSIDGVIVSNDINSAADVVEMVGGRLDVIFSGLKKDSDIEAVLNAGVSGILVRPEGKCLLPSYRILRKFSPATLAISASE